MCPPRCLCWPRRGQEKPPANLSQQTPRTPYKHQRTPGSSRCGAVNSLADGGRPGYTCKHDKPGPVTLRCSSPGPGERSARPVYGASTGREPVTPGCGGGTTAARGRSTGPLGRSRRFFVTATGVFGRSHGLPTHWSGGLCRPGPRREPRPRAAFRGAKRDHL